MKLVATIGAGKYEVTTYILQENSYETRYCPLAIAGLLRPSVVLLVMTEQAQAKHGEGLAQGLEELGVPFREVLIPNGATREEMWEIFRILVEQVEPGDEVAFDITHGFRHLPLLSFLAGFFLCFAKQATLTGIYYGAFDASRDGMTPVFDLSSFEELVHWTSATLAFDRFGSAEAAGDLLARAQDMVRRQGRGEPVQLKRAGRLLQSLSRAIMAGRTPEVLDEAARLSALVARPGDRARTHEEVSTWAPPFVTLLDRTLEGFADLARCPGEAYWRACLRLAKWYRQHGHVHLAGQLLREVMVTAVVEVNRGDAATRDPAVRQWAENWLNLEAMRRTRLGRTWAELRECRNDLAHMGFRPHPKPVTTMVDMLDRQLQAITDLHDSALTIMRPGTGPAGGSLLLAPLGLSPGLLYTAVLRLKPDCTVVVTSQQGADLARQAVARAEAGEPLTVLTVKDPHTGFAEAEGVIERLVEQVMQQPPEEVWVNLAGGTTALQYIVTRAGERMQGMVPLLRTVAMVDRRPPEEQHANPYILGDLVELE
ncbi:MAG: TIGR02221 family CRISPR-associated protein [Bacillota bacterium]